MSRGKQPADRLVQLASAVPESSPPPKIRIDDHIPLRRILTRVPTTVYPLAEMKVGQSFFVANRGRRKETVREKVRTQARRLRPKEFAIRSEGNDGMRVWRVK